MSVIDTSAVLMRATRLAQLLLCMKARFVLLRVLRGARALPPRVSLPGLPVCNRPELRRERVLVWPHLATAKNLC